MKYPHLSERISFAVIFLFFPFILLKAQYVPSVVDSVTLKTIRQSNERIPQKHYVDLGLGLGLDYGGLIGAKVVFNPIPYLGIFAAGGWEIVGFGWNAGITGRILPANGMKMARPYIKVMYGANGVTKVEGKEEYNKIFYGITAGLGLELRFGRERRNGLNIDLNIPFRSPEFFDQYNRIKNDPEVTITSSLLPFTVSFGFQHEF